MFELGLTSIPAWSGYVRLSPDSDRRADIAARLKRAMNDIIRPMHLRAMIPRAQV